MKLFAAQSFQSPNLNYLPIIIIQLFGSKWLMLVFLSSRYFGSFMAPFTKGNQLLPFFSNSWCCLTKMSCCRHCTLPKPWALTRLSLRAILTSWTSFYMTVFFGWGVYQNPFHSKTSHKWSFDTPFGHFSHVWRFDLSISLP